jgi:hypothetical protein
LAASTQKERETDAIRELEERILSRFPQAAFEIVKGSDPPGTYIEVSESGTDFDELFDEIMATVREPLSRMQNRQRLRIYVMPVEARETGGS